MDKGEHKALEVNTQKGKCRNLAFASAGDRAKLECWRFMIGN